MLSRAELEGIARTITGGNVGHAEKLYVQDVILSTISRETVDEYVFKGGTALLKCYQLDRFSEDLDFTARDASAFRELVDAVARDLDTYGMAVSDRSLDEEESSCRARFGVEGPLYTGQRQSLCFVQLHVNTKSTVADIEVRRYTPPFTDIRSFEVVVLPEEEILAEKIRALLTREQPRDLYDIYHLIEKSVQIAPHLVQSKLEYYDRTYEPESVLERARRFEGRWASLSVLVYGTLPPFDRVLERLEQALDRSE